MMDSILLPETDLALLQSRSCQTYFSIVTGDPSCEPMVVAHIPALISQPNKLPVRHILSRLQINTLYPAKTQDVLKQTTDSSAASSSANSNFPHTNASRSRSDGSNTQVTVVMVKTAVQAKKVSAGETCYVFDMLLQAPDIVKELRSLMENSSVVKVIHDCRQDPAALFYQLQIGLLMCSTLRLLMAWLLSGMACWTFSSKTNIALSSHLTWARLPSKCFLLSKANAQWYWDPADKDSAQAADSYRARAKLPTNVDLEMSFPLVDGVQSYKSNFAVEEDNHDNQDEKLPDSQGVQGSDQLDYASVMTMLDLLPYNVGYAVAEIFMHRRRSKLVVIVADADRDVIIRLSDGFEEQLHVRMDMTAAVKELQAACRQGPHQILVV
ncbi:TPA: hypothetical protein ACH3X3_006609 [Trebouxia sp. C0006]